MQVFCRAGEAKNPCSVSCPLSPFISGRIPWENGKVTLWCFSTKGTLQTAKVVYRS